MKNSVFFSDNIQLQDNPFNLFFEFLTQCATHGDFKGCQQNLLDFKMHCLNLKSNVRIKYFKKYSV